MENETVRIGKQARDCHDLGWSLIELTRHAKHPTHDWKEAVTRRASFEEVSDYFMEPIQPNNYGVVCGAISDIIVLDIDKLHGGEQSAKTIFAKHGRPVTPTVKTPHGWHMYFEYVDGLPMKNSAGKLADGLDIKTDSGYV